MKTTIYKSVAIIVIFTGLFTYNHISAATNDFYSGCDMANSSLCRNGFDFDNEAGQTGEIYTFALSDSSGLIFPTQDTSMKASGAGSAKFIIPSNTSENSSGQIEIPLSNSTNGLATSTTFYVQFRQRFSPEMFNAPMGGSGWRQINIAYGGGDYGDPISLGLGNTSMAGTPKIYIGANNPVAQNPSDGVPVNYVANQWMTFKIKITLGAWNTPTTAIQVWAADEGHPLKQIFSTTTANMSASEDLLSMYPNLGINKIVLGPDNPGKDPSTTHLQATTWYDDLIVSKTDITDPYIPPNICSYYVQQTPQNFVYRGGNGAFSLSVSDTSCGWTVLSSVPWISITTVSSGTGNSEVRYSVNENSGSSRTGTINVSGKTVTVVENGQ